MNLRSQYPHSFAHAYAGTWKTTLQAWSTPKGAQIPLPACYDVLGNLFNVQSPSDLDGTVSQRLATIVVPGQVCAWLLAD